MNLNSVLLSLLLLFPLTTFSAQERFYLGAFTAPGKAEGIYTALLDPATGHLGPVTLAAKANSPGYLALSPDAIHLYAVTTDGGGSVASYSIGRDGVLNFANRVPSGGSDPCHLSTSGSNVFVANYGSGNIACIHADIDGSLSSSTQVIPFSGSGPNPIRQKKPCAHCVIADSACKFVYACDLGTDHVWTCRFDSSSSQFRGLSDVQGKVPPGSGPRHLAFGPGENFAYVNGEMGRNITVFQRDKSTGSLDPIQTLPLVPDAAPDKSVYTAEVRCHPSGKWLYVSSRGDDIIAVFAIGPDGKLTFLQSSPALVKFPRGFAIDPSGRWLVSAGQNDNRLAVLSIDQTTGKLTPTAEHATAPTPVDVLFLPAP